MTTWRAKNPRQPIAARAKMRRPMGKRAAEKRKKKQKIATQTRALRLPFSSPSLSPSSSSAQPAKPANPPFDAPLRGAVNHSPKKEKKDRRQGKQKKKKKKRDHKHHPSPAPSSSLHRLVLDSSPLIPPPSKRHHVQCVSSLGSKIPGPILLAVRLEGCGSSFVRGRRLGTEGGAACHHRKGARNHSKRGR